MPSANGARLRVFGWELKESEDVIPGEVTDMTLFPKGKLTPINTVIPVT